MKKIYYLLALLMIGLSSCKTKEYKGKPIGKEANFENLLRSKQQKTLAEIYYEHGNFINTKQFPPIVRNTDVLAHLNDWLIIDIRKPDAYEAGHINGAYNVPKDKVIDFLKNKQKAAAYPKVVFVCYTGQMASYVTGITRYAGFDNTYVMLFGMAGWNSQFSAPLKNGFGDRFQDMIVKESDKSGAIIPEKNEGEEIGNHKIDLSKLPKLPKKLPSILITERANNLLKANRKDFLLKADEVFPEIKQDINKYYDIFYMNKPRYYAAHIKGSVQFTSRKDLSLDAKLTDIPADKPVLIYCKTGHTSGNATAYLNMLGYKAHSLMFGVNSFMHSFWKQKEWMSSVDALINDFPVVEGKKRTNNKIVALTPKKKGTPKAPIAKHKKKEVSGGCG